MGESRTEERVWVLFLSGRTKASGVGTGGDPSFSLPLSEFLLFTLMP